MIEKTDKRFEGSLTGHDAHGSSRPGDGLNCGAAQSVTLLRLCL